MAIGATWNTELAERVGRCGNELAALGFNLYIGPSLDVLKILQVQAVTWARASLAVTHFGSVKWEAPMWLVCIRRAIIITGDRQALSRCWRR